MKRVPIAGQEGMKFKKMRKVRNSEKVQPEEVIQRQVNDFLNQAGFYYVRISDRAYRAVSGKDDSLSGLPDNCVEIPINDKFFLGCNVELKRKGGKKTAQQKARSRETPYVFIDDFDEFLELIREMVKFKDSICTE